MSYQKYLLRLYIAGKNPTSLKALADIQNLAGKYLKDICTLEVVDVLKRPQDAERDRIMATPTLMRVFPEPTKKIIGDFSDSEKVIGQLELYIGKRYERR